MHMSDRRRSVSIVALFVAVAIFGYVLGHDRARVASGTKSRSIFAARVLLNYPLGWRQTSAAPKIPGLSIAHQISLAPDGNAAQAGLVTGQLPAGELSPLPKGFIAGIRQVPDTEVVDLPETQAYRYAPLSIPGFGRTLRLYVVPNPGGGPTTLVCYASAKFSVYMRACEQIVATLTLVGQPPSYDLVPEQDYVRKLSAAIGVLNVQRGALRHAISLGAKPATVQRFAAGLAAGFAVAAASISLLEPAGAAGQEQAALTGSLLRARDAYTALAAAVAAHSPTRLADARGEIGEVETSIDAALESFALLGYRA
jgi:hypothetical protein